MQKKRTFPPQQQVLPGQEKEMKPQPQAAGVNMQGQKKLEGKVAIITGGDSGIGHAVAVAFAREGANVSIVYLSQQEEADARTVKAQVEAEGRTCLMLRGDIGDEHFARDVVEQTVSTLGHLNIIVNNAGEQHLEAAIEDLTAEQLERTFRSNIFSMFYLSKAALKYLKAGDTIINTTSVTAYKGSPGLLSYSSTKGAIVSFTRSLSLALESRGIRVNGVAPGPVWTPLIPASFPAEKVEAFGANVPMERAAQPEEIAPSYVYLASPDSSYMSGQILHLNGGEIVGG